MSAVRLGIHGAAGRMGRRLIALGSEDPQLQIVAALEQAGHVELGKDAGIVAGLGEKGVRLSHELRGEPEVCRQFSETAEAGKPGELGELPGCDQWWNEYLPEALLTFEPTMVVLVGGYVLAYEVDPAGDDQWCHLGDGSGRCEVWAADRLRATTERVHTYAPSAHLVIATGGYVDPWGPQSIDRSTIGVLNELIRAEAIRDGDSVVDLGAWLNDHLDLMFDGIHLGADGIDALKPWIAGELEAVAAGQRLSAG